MRLTVAGWSRNHGATEVFDVSLSTVKTDERGSTFGKDKPILMVERSDLTGSVLSVTLNCFADLRLGGEYQVRTTLTRQEVSKLFYLMNKTEIDAMAKTLPIVRRM